MELSDILALVHAGYTREEIAQMGQTPAPETAAEPVAEPVAEAVPEAQPQPTQTPTPVPEHAEPSIADLMQSIAKLTGAIQANAIRSSIIPEGVSDPPKAEDMLAEIIRPTYKERG